MITITIKNCNVCELSGPAKFTNRLYNIFRIKHPDAWHILMYSRANNWDGYVKYISDYGQFRIGLLNKVYQECIKTGQKVKIIDQRPKLGITPEVPNQLGDKLLREVQKKALEKILFNKVGDTPFIICASDLAVNFGKCIGKDSLVYTDHGVKKISDMMDRDGKLNKSYKVLGKDGLYHKITAGVYNRIKAIKITTKMGYTQICGFDRHRYFTVNSQGNLDWVLANTLKIGDSIPIYKPKIKSKFKSNQKWLDEAYLMGNLHGNGCIRKISDSRIHISISGVDTENRDEIINILNSISKTNVKYTPHRRIKNGWYISKSDKELSRLLLSKYPELVNDSHHKVIPDIIMNAPTDIRCQYIAGLWDTDGSKHNKVREYSFSSVCEENIHRLQLLLLSIGIHSFVSPKETLYKGKKGVTYRLRIPSTQVDKFQELIPMRISRKRYINRPIRNHYGDKLPVEIGKVVRDIYLKQSNTKGIFPDLNRTIRNQLRDISRLTLSTLEEFCRYNSNNQWLKDILNFSKEVYWDKIKSIEVIPEYDCYDICVEDVHHYIADGFICHNTLIFCGLHQAFKRKLKTVLLLNSSDLFNQFKTEIPQLLPGEDIAFIQGSKCNNWGNFNVCMVQSLAANIRKYQKFLSEVDMVLIDEADVIDNKTYKTVIQHLYNSRIRVGLSGTIYMSQLKKKLVHNMNIMSFIGDKVNEVKLAEMVKKGYSTPIVCKMIYAPFKYSGNDDYPTEYKKVITDNVKAYELSLRRTKFNLRYNRLPMLIVCKFIDHCEKLYKYYIEHLGDKYTIQYVHHNTKGRDEILRQFRNGEIDILIATTIISRGQNFPELKYLQNTASMDSNEKSLQILGRLARTHMSKKKAYLDDLVFPGNYLKRHGNHRKNYYLKEKLKVIKIENP